MRMLIQPCLTVTSLITDRLERAAGWRLESREAARATVRLAREYKCT